MRKSEEIKSRIKNAGLKCWQVADTMGISSFTLSVWFRNLEAYPERIERIEEALKTMTA